MKLKNALILLFVCTCNSVSMKALREEEMMKLSLNNYTLLWVNTLTEYILNNERYKQYELTLTLITGNSTGPALNDHIWADRFTIPWLLRAHDSLIEDPAPSKEDPEPSIEYPAQHPRAKSLVAGVLAGSQLTLPYTPYTPLAAIPGDS